MSGKGSWCPKYHAKIVKGKRHTRCLHFGRVCSIIIGPDPEWSDATCVRLVWFGRGA